MFTGFLVAGLIGAAMCGGVFYAFSTFVMPSLGDVPPAEGIRAMQAINVSAVRPGFMLLFMGTTVLCVLIAVLAFVGWGDAGTAEAMGGAAAYLLGCFVVTAAGNVPLNDRLASADAETLEGHHTWSAYLIVWTRWNHVRTAACVLAALLFLGALSA